jgi:hypothetical protein
MTPLLRELVRGAKQKGTKIRPLKVVRRRAKRARSVSPYEDGVRMAKDAVEAYAKDLEKIK